MCYTVPAAGAIITSIIWTKTKSESIRWLSLLFGGGALFGIIDHWWNGELFLISENIANDLSLGVVISVANLIIWKSLISLNKNGSSIARRY